MNQFLSRDADTGASALAAGKTVDTSASGVDVGTAVVGIRTDTMATITPADGDYAPLRLSSTGALRVTDASAGGSQHTEDSAHSSGDIGTMALVVRNDTLAALAGTDGDYAPLQVNAAGALYVDGSGGTQPVSGTVTANLSATDNAVLDAIAVSDASIDGKITACNTGAVVVASGAIVVSSGTVALAAGTNAFGKLAANSGVDIGDVDVTSVVPGTSAGSLGKAEDAAHTTGDVGVMSLAVRNDTLAALAGTDGDYAPLQVNADGALYVSSSGGGSTQYVEDTPHTTGATGTMSLAVQNNVLTSLTSSDGDYAPLQVNSQGALYTALPQGAASSGLQSSQVTYLDGILTRTTSTDNKITACNTGAVVVSSGAITANLSAVDNAVLDAIAASDASIDGKITACNTGAVVVSSGTVGLAAGTNAFGKLAANSGVDIGDVDVTSVITGTGATNLGKAEDAAHTSGDVGVMSLAVRNDTLAALAGTDGDYAPLQVNADGALYVSSSGGGGSTQYAEDTAHSSGDTGTMSLAVRNDTLAALAGTDGDYAPLQVNAQGALHVDGSGFTQPVSGTVTADLSATDNAVLDAIAASAASSDGKITACDTGAVVIASGSITADLSATDNAVLDAIAASAASSDGKITACDTGAVVIASGSITANLSATDNAVLDAIAASAASSDGKITACNTGAVVVASGSITATLSATDNAVLDAIAASTASTDGKITACDTGAVVVASGAVVATLSATDNAVLDAIAAQNAAAVMYMHQALTNTPVSVIGSAVTLKRLILSNSSGTAAFFRAYNKATAATLGTDVPVMILCVPANSITSIDVMTAFSLGLSLAVTASPGDAAVDAGGPLAVHVLYA